MALILAFPLVNGRRRDGKVDEHRQQLATR